MVFGVKEEGMTDQTMTIEAMWSQKEVEKVERKMLTSSKYTFWPDTYITKILLKDIIYSRIYNESFVVFNVV